MRSDTNPPRAKTEKGLKQAEGKPASEGFLSKAKPEVVTAERAEATDLRDQLKLIKGARLM